MRKSAMVIVTLFVLFATTAAPLLADGCIIARDSDLWEALEEGQQFAVVTVSADGTIHTDLFISLIDHTGISHEITFFLPLGHSASEFSVAEEDSSTFEGALTKRLDRQLQLAALARQSYDNRLLLNLIVGSWIITGGWGWPILPIVPIFLFSVGSLGPQPLQVLQTDSSQVSIYSIDENTDLAALVATTGLDPSVQETLRAYEGQQIAVISMQMHAPSGEDAGVASGRDSEGDGSQLGLHLDWTSQAIDRPGGGWEHHYPLGTGGGWARPIPLTRVYVIADAGVDFRVEYPVYGVDLSGYDSLWGKLHIDSLHNRTAYAIEDLITPEKHIWRAIYTQANPTENVHIIQDTEAANLTQAEIDRYHLRGWTKKWSWLLGAIVAFMLWLFCWRYVMPSYLGRTYHWLEPRFWLDAAICPLINALVMAAFYALLSYSSVHAGSVLILLAGIAGGGSAPIHFRFFPLIPPNILSHPDEEHRGKAVEGFWTVIFLTNIGYFILAAIYIMVLVLVAG